MEEYGAYLLAVHLAVSGEQAFVSSGHACQAVTNEVRLWVVVPAAHHIVDSDRVDEHEPAAAHETAVDKGRAVRVRPARDQPCVLLVMELWKVAHEQ